MQGPHPFPSRRGLRGRSERPHHAAHAAERSPIPHFPLAHQPWSCGRFKGQGGAVHAVPQPRRAGAVGEDVPQVALARGAVHLREHGWGTVLEGVAGRALARGCAARGFVPASAVAPETLNPPNPALASVRGMKGMDRSASSSTAPGSGALNDGHPVPESNLVAVGKSGAPHPAQQNVPARFSLLSGEDPGRSVPCLRSTR